MSCSSPGNPLTETTISLIFSKLGNRLAVSPDQSRRRFAKYQSIGFEFGCFSSNNKFVKRSVGGGMDAIRQKIRGYKTYVGLSIGSRRKKFLEILAGYLCLVAGRPVRVPPIELWQNDRALVGSEHAQLVLFGFEQVEVKRTNRLVEIFPNTAFLRASRFAKSEKRVDLVVGH